MTYPVQVEVVAPPRFERVQLLLRLAILIAIGFVGVSVGWLSSLLYLVLPVFAAITVSSRGPDRYLAEVGPPLGRLLGWVVGFYAYMMLVSDRFPTESQSRDVRLIVGTQGHPTAGSALLRWITSLPSVLVLALLGVISGLLAFLAAISILFTESEPQGILRFQVGMLRWWSRLLAYHASLVETYPPFSLDLPPMAHPVTVG